MTNRVCHVTYCGRLTLPKDGRICARCKERVKVIVRKLAKDKAWAGALSIAVGKWQEGVRYKPRLYGGGKGYRKEANYERVEVDGR